MMNVRERKMTKGEELRKKLWIEVAVIVAGALGCCDKTAPGAWADAALEAYDEQFGDNKNV